MHKTNAGFTRLLALVLSVAMLVGMLPMSALAAQTETPSATLQSTDETGNLTDAEKQRLFAENMNTDIVSEADLPDPEEEVRVIVELEVPSLLDVKASSGAAEASMVDFLGSEAASEQLLEIQSVADGVLSQMEQAGIHQEITYTYTAVTGGFAAKMTYADAMTVAELDGVRRVSLCQLYYPDVVGEATLGQALTDAEVAAYSNDTPFQGEGMVIGILDTGLDWTHEAFANAPEVQKLTRDSLKALARYDFTYDDAGNITDATAYSYAALWYSQANSTSTDLALLTADDLYKSGKVPFAFDYADADPDVIPSAKAVESYGNDHGTHVAGIAAGKTVDENGNVTFAGQAPEAQLAIFKVFSDSSNGASTDTILAALNDAILLGVDVINMSLGSSGGFGAEADGSVINTYYNAVKASGILLNTSGGNAYSSGYGGAQGDFASTSDPDTGITGSPGSYDASLATASINANATSAFAVGDQNVPYNDVPGHDFTGLLLDGAESASFEYVMVPGYGEASDYKDIDVSGKIAVVIRGNLSFNDKQLNAAAAGAVGCVIYNNRDGYLLNMSVDNYTVPTVCVSYANGIMMGNQEDKTLTVTAGGEGLVTMSDFSSWGPLPSLELKPEITAPGGSIYSSLPFGQYGYMSGTSMSSPYMAGVSAAAMQYVRKSFPGMDADAQRALVNRLLMSTADIVYDGSGVAYSPRRQGAGMVDLAGAINTPAYLYVRGSDKTKIELGDDSGRTGVYDLSFQVKNLTGAPVSYTVDTLVQTESVTADGRFIAQAGFVLDAETQLWVTGGSLEGDVLTVPANGEAGLVITVKLSQEAKDYMDANFENGIYVEGFVELTNDNDPSLSVPYLAFYGDWTEAPIFEDADYYNGEPVKMYATTPAGVYAMMYTFPLGIYPFNVPEGSPEPEPSRDRASLDLGTGNGISNLYYLMAGQLRGAKETKVTITDTDTGEIVHTMDGVNSRKAYYNSSSGSVRPGYVGDVWPALMGYSVNIPSGTRMNYTVTAYLDDDGVQKNKNNTYSFDFTADSEMPWVVNRNDLKFYYGEDGRMYLDVVLADNFALAGATLYSAYWTYDMHGNYSMKPYKNYYDGITPAVREDGSVPGAYETYTYTFDVTDFYKNLTDGSFYILAYDYALNECALRVTLDEIPVTAIALDTTEVTLPIRGYVQLDAIVTPDNATNQALVWSTSDASVAEVKDGLVKAIAPGTATITVKAKNYTDITASCAVTVTEEVGPEVPMEAFTLNRTALTINVGDTDTSTKLSTYTPYTATNLEVTWSSSDETVATVDETGAVTGLAAGTCVITATAVLGDASASYNLTVKQLAGGTGSFAIDGDVLVSYSGSEETVVVPDGIREIAEGAFNNNDAIHHVVMPDTLKVIGYQAFYDCDNLLSVTLPEYMESIAARAFYGCEKLETFGLEDKGVIPKGLTEINERSFYFCYALKGDLVIPDGVTTVGPYAFGSCKAITSVTMADSVTELSADGNQFSGCYSLTGVNLSASLTELPKNCFSSCGSLTELPDLKNVTALGNACFQHLDGATSITIPAQVTRIGSLCFAYADILESVHFEGSPAFLSSTDGVTPATSVFSNDVSLTSVTGNFTTITDTMFEKCTSLVNFVVPDNVSSIGKNAFKNCTALETVTFPATYTRSDLSMGNQPFVGCTGFQGIVIAEGCTALKMVDGALFSGDGKKLIALPSGFAQTTYTVPDGVEVIGASAFYGNTTLTSVTFPDSLKTIEPYAFYGCTKLTAVDLPDGVTTVGAYAFYNCAALTSLDLGKSLTAVEPYTFNGIAKVTSIVLPDTVKTVGDYAFYKCNVATTITIPEGVTAIGKYAFYGCKKATSILLPATLTELGTYAFYDCNAAKTIDCGGLTEIPDRAFHNCKAVTAVTMSDDVTTIGAYAFYYCQYLADVNWPSQLETVGNYAFYFIRAAKDLDLSGTKIKTIGDNAFYQCYEARSLVFPETLESIGNKAFAYLNYNKTAYVPEIHLPASVTYVHKDAFYYANGLQNITVDPANPVYTSADGILILRQTGELYLWPMANTTTEFTVPANMTEIPAKMFQNNSSLKKITIHSGVTYIGSNAFAGSKIAEFVFEPSANGLAIDSYAFNNCDALKSIELPYGTTSLNVSVFSSCDKLESVYLPDTITDLGTSTFSNDVSLTDVHLSAGLAEMPALTFSGCSALEEITLPAGMRTCGINRSSSPYSNCTSLKNIWVAEGSRYFKSVDGVLYDANGTTLRVYPMGRTAESYTIPEGVVRIGERAALANPYLKSVSFPSTLVRVGDMAFYNCTELKDLYFNGMTAPVLETTLSQDSAWFNYACYWNFVDKWMVIDTTTHKVVPNELGLNLYYPEGATGYDGYVWEVYFQSGTTNVMDASYFTVTGLTATEAEGRTARLTWEAVKKSGAEAITYKVERANVTHIVTDDQNTWLYEDYETLAEGLTETAFTDTTALHFGMGYAYRVSAYNAKGETGPAAVATLVIAVDENNADEMAALAVIQAIEALKPIENLTLDAEARLYEIQAMYDALTEAQQALVPNLSTLDAAFAWIDGLHAAQVETMIDALPDLVTVSDAAAIAAAREAYEALTEAQKTLVTNLDKLEACEEALKSALSVEAVEQLIAALPKSDDVTLADAEAIAAAREAYEALTDEEKARVNAPYLVKLELCENALARLQAVADVEALIAALPDEITIEDAEAVAAAREAYDALDPAQQGKVGNYGRLLAAEAAIRELENLPFTDVAEGAWYYDGVEYVYQHRLMNGTGATTFAPYENVTRGMMITVLHRMAGAPEVTETSSFTDVDANRFFADAVAWAQQTGIANGYPDGTFRPDDSVTRADMVTFLYRYAAMVEGKDVSTTGSLDGFADAESVPNHAAKAMIWAVENGVIHGTGPDTLAPNETAQRGQLAVILLRYLTVG